MAFIYPWIFRICNKLATHYLGYRRSNSFWRVSINKFDCLNLGAKYFVGLVHIDYKFSFFRYFECEVCWPVRTNFTSPSLISMTQKYNSKFLGNYIPRKHGDISLGSHTVQIFVFLLKKKYYGFYFPWIETLYWLSFRQASRFDSIPFSVWIVYLLYYDKNTPSFTSIVHK